MRLMRYQVGVEEIEPEHWVASVFELPGCFSRGHTDTEALGRVPARVGAHLHWLVERGAKTQLRDEPIEIQVAEIVCSCVHEREYRVNAFFADDRRALSSQDIPAGLWLLENTRRDLLELLQPLGDDELRAEHGEGTSIESILMHLAWTEWWYVDRLGQAFEREGMALDPFVALRDVRALFTSALATWVGDELVHTRAGEQWSARKVLRRALWHERDHSEQIASLLKPAP